MAEIGLQGSGIDALIGERVTASMPQHVGMDLKSKFGFFAGAGKQLGEARRWMVRRMSKCLLKPTVPRNLNCGSRGSWSIRDFHSDPFTP
jgi:hypothetical protein